MLILGIDPGITGGLAFYRPEAPALIEVHDIPVAGGEIDVDTLARIIRRSHPDEAMIERATAMPKQGVASTFKFGAAYGALRATVAALGIPQHLIAAGVWKRHYRLNSDKEQSRALALRLWPGAGCFARKKDHGRAEAALIARYRAETMPQPGVAAPIAEPAREREEALL